MPANLGQILASTRRCVEQAKASTKLADLEARAAAHSPRGFRKALTNRVAVIAELKKASPSKGLIRPDFDPSYLARSLENGGAAALSVLTDEEYFQGSLKNLTLASQAVSIPCLRKDFILDEFQILEARANRADAILLIVAALKDEDLRRLRDKARELQLDVLCEVHDERELARASDLGFDLIGVNNRNLHNFEVDNETATRLVTKIPVGVVKIAESGIKHGSDIQSLRDQGYDAFLIGESLMRSPDPEVALSQLLKEAQQLTKTAVQ